MKMKNLGFIIAKRGGDEMNYCVQPMREAAYSDFWTSYAGGTIKELCKDPGDPFVAMELESAAYNIECWEAAIKKVASENTGWKEEDIILMRILPEECVQTVKRLLADTGAVYKALLPGEGMN